MYVPAPLPVPHSPPAGTLSSRELQDIVSRAIRNSARESFVRLVSIDNLDHVLPAELGRLHDFKRAAQAKYRFQVQRRTMLLRALNSAAPSDKNDEDGTPVVSRLTRQLCETIRDCDACLEEVLGVSDQIAQITRLIDVHWASALAVALRKLNTSYGKRTANLNTANERISQLEAELSDAWKEAERMAREMDDFDAVVSEYEDEGEAVIERAEIVSVPTSPAPNASMSLLRIEPMSPRHPPTTEPDVPDSASVRSMKSMRSGRSARSTRDGTRLGLVTAAKTRSHRASKGSLRLPGGRGTASRPQTPPIPDLPPAFTSAPLAGGMPNPWSSAIAAAQPRRRVSLEDIMVMMRPAASIQPNATVDDIYIRPQLTSNDIEVVPRTPPHPKAVDDIHLLPPRYSAEETASAEIPSIWLHADAPKTPAERVESLLQQQQNTAKTSSYHKLKTLTKRYSLPFPLFHSKSLQVRPRSE
ncbi:hypothetical protein BD779DRAFT_514527 [Infundibulicybe gibba]|nr:hypothetical protein BD779DRAFT_514527 [Infundibulicybe gibba]